MPERVFLCGLSKEQRTEFSEGTALSLEKQVGNLKLKLDRMRDRLVGAEPRRLTDFIEIASYVFAADRMTSRGALSDPGFGAGWRRHLRLVVAVRDLVFWLQPQVKETMADALGFLSEDTWLFDFVENLHPIPLKEYFDFREQEDHAEGGTSIVLFSGGLDSLAGAVHELRHTNRNVVLVSHLNLPGIGKRQKFIAAKLTEAFPRRVTHVWVENSLTGILDRETTQRTRSFFFTATAAVAAHIEKADRIRFYENGVMSVNLPIATQVVGARSSRSTHPRSLQLLDRVVQMLSLNTIGIDNPFIWKTKIEVVNELAKSPQAGLITSSVSCTRARTVNSTHQPHCGTCVQCLQRRISTLAGGAGEYDESEGYETDFLREPRKDGEDRVMALETISLALDCSSLSDSNFIGRFIGPVSWVLQSFPAAERDGAMRNVIDLYRRHGAAVRKLLIDAQQTVLGEVIDRTLSPDSLLALVLKSRLVDVRIPAVEGPAERLPEPKAEKPGASRQAGEIHITVDQKRQRILIRDWVELYGPAIFAIMQLLVELSMQGRARPGLPSSYKGLLGKEIADQLGMSDEQAVRSAIKRAREELKLAAIALGEEAYDQNAVIDSVGRGYRLNPKVIIVTMDEFRQL